MPETLRPHERIRKRKDFSFIYRKGKRYRGNYFTLVYLSNDLEFSRMAVVVSRKIGKAVARNRIKRRMRTLFRRNKDLLKTSLDLIFIPYRGILKAPWQEISEDYCSAVKSVSRNG